MCGYTVVFFFLKLNVGDFCKKLENVKNGKDHIKTYFSFLGPFHIPLEIYFFRENKTLDFDSNKYKLNFDLHRK